MPSRSRVSTQRHRTKNRNHKNRNKKNRNNESNNKNNSSNSSNNTTYKRCLYVGLFVMYFASVLVFYGLSSSSSLSVVLVDLEEATDKTKTKSHRNRFFRGGSKTTISSPQNAAVSSFTTESPPRHLCNHHNNANSPFFHHDVENRMIAPFLTQHEARDLLTRYLQQQQLNPEATLTTKKNKKATTTMMTTIQFAPLLQHLIQSASARNRTVLTLQMGGNDGRTHDPLYHALVVSTNHPPPPSNQKKQKKQKQKQKKQKQTPQNKPPQKQQQLSLAHWMPIVVEPARQTLPALQETYRAHVHERGLHCYATVPWAADYSHQRSSTTSSTTGSSSSGGDGEQHPQQRQCRFWSLDTNSSYIHCQRQPLWVKSQIGTLSNAELSPFVNRQPKKNPCFVEEWVDCGSVSDLFHRIGLTTTAATAPVTPAATATATAATAALDMISFLQVDIEGFEGVVIPGFIRECLALRKTRHPHLSSSNNQHHHEPMHDMLHDDNDDDEDEDEDDEDEDEDDDDDNEDDEDAYSYSFLPPLIQYEIRVLQYNDQQHNTSRLKSLREFLCSVGYDLLKQPPPGGGVNELAVLGTRHWTQLEPYRV